MQFIQLLCVSPLPPHPRPSIVPRIIQTLASIGKQFGTDILQVEEVAIGRRVSASWRKRPSLIGADI